MDLLQKDIQKLGKIEKGAVHILRQQYSPSPPRKQVYKLLLWENVSTLKSRPPTPRMLIATQYKILWT